jgi:uncharacterized repeat protein (TIGR01451 family)
MVSRIFSLAPLALGSTLALATLALAQESPPEEAPENVPSLSDRLEQFRKDLLGDPGAAEQRAEAERKDYLQEKRAALAQRNGQPAQTPSGFQPQNQSSSPRQRVGQPGNTAASAAPAPATPGGVGDSVPAPVLGVRTPTRMQVQSARRARANRGLISPTTPRERGEPIEAMADGTRPRPADEPTDADGGETAEDAAEAPAAGEPTPARIPRLARAPDRATDRDVPTLARGEGHAEPTAVRPNVLFTTHSPAISVEATGPRTVRVGEQAQFAVKLRNVGAPANNVVVMIDVPEHAEVASAHATIGTVPVPTAERKGGPLEWRITRLEGKSAEMLNLVLVPRGSSSLDLAVRFSYAPEASQAQVEVQEPKLEMMISGPQDVQFGETKIYKLSLSNPGNGNAENVVIGLLPVGRSGEAVSSHKLGTLRAGESKTIDVELTARQAGKIAIRAQAYADGGLRTEASEEVLVRRANLQIEAEAPRVTFAGTVATYRVHVTNSGDAPADDVQVAAMLPPNAKYMGSTAAGKFDSQQGKVHWLAGSLKPGDARTFDLQCALATPGDNRLQFLALASGDLSASAAANTQVEALADLKIEVHDPQGPVAVGGDAVFEVVIRNRGAAPAEQIDLAVFFSEGLEATTVEGGPHEIATGQVVFQPIAAIGANETVLIKVHAKADRTGHHVFRAELTCQSLGTKLAAEEATYFYGDAASDAAADAGPSAPQPTPATPAEPQPTPAADAEAPAGDEPPPVPQ